MKVHNPNKLPTAPISDLLPSQGDLKDLTEKNYKKLKNTIERRGFSVPVYVWEDKQGVKHLLDGHQRQRVLTTEGWNEPIPYLLVPAENLQEAMARLLEITSQYATITQEGIDEFIAKYELNEAEVYEATSFDALTNYATDEPEKEVEEDEAPEVDESEPPKSKLGEIYQLGRHRVMCGDSTNKSNVELLMNGNKANMVYTDPPYGMDLDTDYSKMSGNEGSGKKYDSGIVDEFSPNMIDSIMSIDAKEIFIWGADYFAEYLPKKNEGSWLVWDKRESGETGSNVDKRFGSMFELCWSKNRHKREIVRFMWAGMMKQSDYDSGRNHPTQKPAKLSATIIQKFGETNDTVVDLFLGSGSTLIACEQTDRICYGMELDPKYVDVIRKRYAKFIQPDDQLPENWEELTPAINSVDKA